MSKNSFEDLLNTNGTTRYYKITVVDKDGLESLKPSEPAVGITLKQPNKPTFISANFDGGAIHLSWSAVDRAVSYTIQRSGENKDKKINGIRQTNYTDTQINIGQKYTYRVLASDKYGISSDSSDKVEINTK